MKNMEQSEEYQQWKKKRDRTRYLGYVIFFLYGVECEAVVVSLLYYLVDRFDMGMEDARFYFRYSLSSRHTTLKQRPSNVHNVQIMLCVGWVSKEFF